MACRMGTYWGADRSRDWVGVGVHGGRYWARTDEGYG